MWGRKQHELRFTAPHSAVPCAAVARLRSLTVPLLDAFCPCALCSVPCRACSPADAVAVLRATGLWLLHDEPEVGPGAAAVAAQGLAVGAGGSGSRSASGQLRRRGCLARRHKALAPLWLVEA